MQKIKAFTSHWVFVYAPPASLLTGNGELMASKLFLHGCQIIGVNNLFTATYHPQTNEKFERLNRNFCTALCKYIGDHLKCWDLYTPALTFSYNRQPLSSTWIAPFDILLSLSISSLLSEQLTLQPSRTPNNVRLLWAKQLQDKIQIAYESKSKAKSWYKYAFDKHIRTVGPSPITESFVFVPLEAHTREKHNTRKLARIADSPFQVTHANEKTVTIQRRLASEVVSKDRVDIASTPMIPTQPVQQIRP